MRRRHGTVQQFSVHGEDVLESHHAACLHARDEVSLHPGELRRGGQAPAQRMQSLALLAPELRGPGRAPQQHPQPSEDDGRHTQGPQVGHRHWHHQQTHGEQKRAQRVPRAARRTPHGLALRPGECARWQGWRRASGRAQDFRQRASADRAALVRPYQDDVRARGTDPTGIHGLPRRLATSLHSGAWEHHPVLPRNRARGGTRCVPRMPPSGPAAHCRHFELSAPGRKSPTRSSMTVRVRPPPLAYGGDAAGAAPDS